MDVNGLGLGGWSGAGTPYAAAMPGQLPVGFGMALAPNEAAMNGYAGLTAAQKEKVILRCRDARTKEQMQEIVDSLVPGTDVREIYEEARESAF